MGKGSLGTLYAELTLKTSEFEKAVIKSKKLADKLNTDIENITDQINEKLKSIGVGLSAGVTLPLTLFGKQALDTFTNFQQSMQNTFSVMGATSAEMEALRKKAEEMGATTRFSASQAADALYNLGSAGQSASQAMSSLDGVLRLAGATGSDLAFTSGTIASTLSQFNLEADKASHIADVYAMAISKSQANMTKLSYSMKYVGPVASGLNIKLETATAALMRLYNTGYGGEMAGTYLRAGLQKLASGADDFKSALESIGLTYDDVNPKTNDFADIIDRLKEKQVDINKANELFGNIAGGAMAKLIEGGGEAIRTMDGLLQTSDGAAKKMQDIQNASFANTKAELASAFEAVQITLTSNVIPAVNIFAQGLTNALKFINELPVGVQTAGTAFAGLAAAAGPLLLVAVGVKKIKQEMVELNMVAAVNPIMAWGAAIAGVAAIAVGIIAQVRKAQEEAEKATGKYYDRAEKLANEAESAKIKNNKISSLMNTYEELSRKVNKTTEEQSIYNATLKELQGLVPDIIIEQDKLGNAYIANAEKAKAAQLELLKIEKEKTEHALLVSNLSVTGASKNLDRYKKERDDLEAQSKIAQEKQEAADKKLNEVQRLIDEYNATGDREIKTRLTRMTGGVTLSAILANAEKEAQTATQVVDKLVKKISEENEKISEQEELLAKNKLLREKIASLDDLINKSSEPSPTKKTRKEHADEKWADYEQQKKRIEEEKKDAALLQQDYDDIGKRMEFVRNKINELKSLSADEIADGQFTRTSKELQDFYQELNRLSKLAEQKKRSETKSIQKKDNSYQAQIEELDKLYKEKIAKAKEYGKNKLDIEKEYEEKRLALIEQFIQKEAKLKGGRDNALGTETKKGSGITLGDELNKTNLLNNAFAAFLQQQKELQSELKKTKEQIEQTEALIKAGNYSQIGGSEEQAKTYLQQLREEANKLELELLKSKYSLAQIDDALKNLDRSGKSSFKLRLIDIEEEQKNAYKVIEEAKRNKQGRFKDAKTDKEIEEVERAYQKAADNIAKNAKVALASGIINGVMGVADTITNIIASAIEQGGMSGIDALKVIGSLTKQIGSFIPGVGGMITGVIGSALGMIGSIAGAISSRAQKLTQEAREDARKFNEETQRQLREEAQKASQLIGDTASKIAKLQAGKKINADTIFDTQSLEIEKKRIDDFLNKVGDLKTEASYSYTAKGTRRRNSSWDFLDLFNKDDYEETYTYTAYANYTVAQVMEKYNEAMRKKDYEAAKKWKDFAQQAINKGLKEAGIDSGNVDAISNYVGNLDSALAQYVKTRDMKSFKDAIKEQLYEALVNKAVMNTMSQRIAQIFDKIEKGEITYEEGLKKIESIGEEAGKIFDEMNKRFGLSAEQAKKEWEQVGKSISQSLANALGEAAYNADWGSFKKSFAAEMKKAIIQSAIESAGIKAKVDEIIKKIMDDGKISEDEINDTIEKLKDLYDNLEGNMAELAKINKALEGGVEIKSKTSGSIIQQLSGADRDWFMEVLKEGFTKINQVIDLKETTIQHMAATQIIINSLIYNSYNSTIYIQATETTDLKGLIGEIVEQALAG